jgi:tetratricopeptide (TPR) repeat protein
MALLRNATALALALLLLTAAGAVHGSDYTTLRDGVEQRLAALQQRVLDSADNRDVTPARELFEGWLYHARLTGDTHSWQQAAAALAELEQRSLTPPCSEQAQLALATHQPARAAEALQACPELAAGKLRADIDLYQGRYAEAVAGMTRLLNRNPLPEYFAWMATWRLYSGSPEEAHALLEAAEKRYHNRNPHQLAWFSLQRGIVALEQRDLERARILFEQSLQRLPGWWLAQEHLAETLLLQADSAGAAALYDEVIASTGAGEFLAARAEIAMAQGDTALADELIERARANFEERLASLAGHAVEFFLDHGPADRALSLARADYEARPFGDSATLLARALLASGDAAGAVAVLEPEVAKGWNTAEARRVLLEAETALNTR